ncbi:hypothetical protein ACAS46_002755 [Vibrio vulnificus]
MTKPKYKLRKLKYGVGINDADYTITKCPYYWKWHNVLYRCYSEHNQATKPSYRDVTVCDEWLTFSNFRDWCIEQEKEVGDISKLDLDKDLLGKGSKIYSPDTCCFLPKKVNIFLENTPRGSLLMGVRKSSSKYSSSARDPLRSKRIYLGTHETEIQAFRAYILKKVELAREMAYSTDLIPQKHVKEALVSFYFDIYNKLTFRRCATI